MDISNLWVGDKLLIVSTHEVGTFEGHTKDGKIFVKTNNGLKEVYHTDVAIFEEVNSVFDEILDIIEDSNYRPTSSRKQSSFSKELDLHLEKLDPNFQNTAAMTVVDFQLNAAKMYIDEAIARKQYKVTIIHGKGEGKLKDYIHHMLDGYKEVRWKMLTNQGGATEVLLEY
jgi:hypothetical protein